MNPSNPSQCIQAPTCNVNNCNLCSSTNSNICTKCVGAYVLSSDGNACTAPTCPSGQMFLGLQCGCLLGQVLVGSTCASCPTQCSSCSTATSCDMCNYGYGFDPTSLSCLSCGTLAGNPKCASCTGSTCNLCKRGHSLVGNTCV